MAVTHTRTLWIVREPRRKARAFNTEAEALAYRDATLAMREAGWVK